MSTDGIQLHPAQAPFLQERQRILMQLEQARSRARRLEEVGASLAPGGHDVVAAGGEIADPPQVVDAAIPQLEQAVAEIDRQKGEIRRLEQDIAAIKSRAQTLVFMIVIAVIVIALGLFFVLRAYV